jgi:prepilin-type N-terminal cleavage/methylation domain-containing protein
MKQKRQSGFTIIELMVALVISAIVTAAVYAIFITQQKTYAIQSGVTDMQQNARAALMLMVRDLRMAGADIGSSFTVQDYAGTNITDQDVRVVQGTGDDPDEITMVYATELDTATFVSDVSSNVVTLTDASGFSSGDFVAFETVRNVYSITGVTSNDLTLTPGTELPGHLDLVGDAFGQTGARAYLVKAITYRLNGTSLQRRDSTNPGATNEIADFITNLQVTPNYTGDSKLVQIILTAEYEDHEGTTRERQYDAVVQLRN